MKWIDVKLSKPKPLEKVLAYDTQHTYIAYMPDEDVYNEHWVICPLNCCEGITGAVTHWMQLPEEPGD